MKNSFNAEEIKGLISSSQVSGIREQISKIAQDFNLGRVTKDNYLRDTLTQLTHL